MKRFLVSIASTAGLLLLAGSSAWADSIPSGEVQWSYNFTPNQTFVTAATGSGSVAFTNNPAANATNNSDIVLTNLKDSSTAPNATPDSFSNTPWSGKLQLTDTASGQSTTMNFSGQFNGTFSGGDPTKNIGGNANITNTFTGTTQYTWVAPNGTHYTVTINNYTPPGPPTASNLGSISAHVSVEPGTAGHAPEPSTLLLSCLGMGFAGAASWRKRRAAAKKAV